MSGARRALRRAPSPLSLRRRLRRVHPSAALFVGVMLAFLLPFGKATASCGADTVEFTGVDLLRGDVGPAFAEDAAGRRVALADQTWAEEVASDGLVPAWLTFLIALAGVGVCVVRDGRGAGLAAFAGLVAAGGLFVALEGPELRVGFELTLLLLSTACLVHLIAAVRRSSRRRRAAREDAVAERAPPDVARAAVE